MTHLTKASGWIESLGVLLGSPWTRQEWVHENIKLKVQGLSALKINLKLHRDGETRVKKT